MNLEALPIEVKESALTDAQKKILNVFYTYNTLDETLKNGSFYITNEQLRTEAEIGSNKTIQSVLSFLIANNFIDRKAGKQCRNGGVASIYILNTENIMNWSKENKKKLNKLEQIKNNFSTPNKKISTPISTPKKMGTLIEKCTDVKCTDLLLSELKAIRQENRELKQMLEYVISQLKISTPNEKISTPLKCTDVKCTTDIDIEIDKEINNKNNTSMPVEETNIEDTTIESLLNDMDNVIEVDGKRCTTISPTYDLFIPDVEVCDSSEQREEDKTNDNNKQSEVEFRTADNITSTKVLESTNTHSNDEIILLNGDSNNDKPYSSMIDLIKTPQPPRPEENENKAVLSHENDSDTQTTVEDNKTQQEAIKMANMGIDESGDNFKDEVREEYRRIISVIRGNYSTNDIANEMENYFNFCRNCNDWNLCIWWYDTLEFVIRKYADWYKKGELTNAIYSIANPIMDYKNKNLNK